MLDNEQTIAIRKLQVAPMRIKKGETVFFNVANFENMGLVRSQKTKTKTKWFLTGKGNRILNVII